MVEPEDPQPTDASLDADDSQISTPAGVKDKAVFVELLMRIAVAANESTTLDEAFQRALDLVCDTIGWPFGQVYLVSEGRERVVLPPSIRHTPPSSPGERVPARVSDFYSASDPIQMLMSTRRAMWIFDVTSSHTRNPTATGAVGAPAALAFPVLVGDEIVAVMEFRADRAMEPDDRLLEVMANIGTQLGRVIERNRARVRLEALAAELERSNKELDQFAYVASHDLREPLRTITNYLKLLAKKLQESPDSESESYLNRSLRGAERLQRMIDDLLALARISTQAKPFAPTDLETVLESATEHLQTAIQEAGATITRDPLPVVEGDRVQLAQLLQNLIANAIKFRGAAAPTIQVSAELVEREWVISVRDNGIGIPPDQSERIFAIFQRLHTQAEYPGTGIGLALCKRIVERHKGRIWVESAPGEGSTFRFTIPVTEEGAP